jgi:transcriptional regulator with XRE-family HTH domain
MRSPRALELDSRACKTLAQNVRRIRKERGTALSAFARQTKRTLAFLKEFERGEYLTASLGDVESFAKALGVNTWELLPPRDPRKDRAVRRNRNPDRL